MLSTEIPRELVALIASVNRVIDAAVGRVASSEIDLRVDEATTIAGRLEALLSTKFDGLCRHLYWVKRRHREGRPHLSDGDLVDLREHDLPDVVAKAESWAAEQLDPELAAAVRPAWSVQQHQAAVQAGFVLLEQRIRALVSADPGLVGRKLVNQLFTADGQSSIAWSDDGILGRMTDKDRVAARELLQGSFSLFRNASAHRPLEYSREETDDVLHLVNLCLRLVKKCSNDTVARGLRHTGLTPTKPENR